METLSIDLLVCFLMFLVLGIMIRFQERMVDLKVGREVSRMRLGVVKTE